MAGTGVELHTREPLQYVAEQALGSEIVSSHAKSGSVIVMNTHTGDILGRGQHGANAGHTGPSKRHRTWP